MKRTSLVLTLLLTLVLVSCTAMPAPTATPSIPATETTTPTLTPTEIVAGIETATSPATITSPPTDVPTPTPTPTLPTETPTPSVLIPVPTGRIYFFWDPSTFTGGVPSAAPKQNLYLALPGNAYDDWHIQTLLEEHLDWDVEAPSHPIVSISLDRTKLAFTVNRDANGDGDVNTPWGGDERHLYVYDLASDLLEWITGPGINYLAWLPDNITVVFSRNEQVLQTELNNLTSSVVVEFPPGTAVGKVTVSPQGNMLGVAINQSPSILYSLFLRNLETGEEYIIDQEIFQRPAFLIWSPDGRWLVANKSATLGITLIEAQMGRVVWESDSPVGVPAWSLDSTQFAFVDKTETTSFLTMFYVADSTITQLVSSEIMTSPVWSPDGKNVAIGSLEDGLSILYLVTVTDGKIDQVFSSNEIRIDEILSWSPDSQWLLFSGSQTLAEQDQQTGIFLIHRSGYPVHFLLETQSLAVNIPPKNFFWLP